MKKIIVFFIALICLIISFYIKDINNKKLLVKKINDEERKRVIKIDYNNEILDINFDDYVIGVVACEMPASFEYDALKSMAVAARTFALYKLSQNNDYIMKTTISDQCYISTDVMKNNWGNLFDDKYNKIKNAVLDTENEYMTYNDQIILSFYFSISNGYTENCENVFSQKLDYLVSVDSLWDKRYQYKESSVNFTVIDFLNKLGIESNKINDIEIERSNTNRINYIYINGIKFKGSKFRSLLSLKSTDVEITHDSNKVYIKTKGNGHGVGMSQYGANAMAIDGYNYEEILKHYYKGVKIVNKL